MFRGVLLESYGGLCKALMFMTPHVAEGCVWLQVAPVLHNFSIFNWPMPMSFIRNVLGMEAHDVMRLLMEADSTNRLETLCQTVRRRNGPVPSHPSLEVHVLEADDASELLRDTWSPLVVMPKNTALVVRNQHNVLKFWEVERLHEQFESGVDLATVRVTIRYDTLWSVVTVENKRTGEVATWECLCEPGHMVLLDDTQVLLYGPWLLLLRLQDGAMLRRWHSMPAQPRTVPDPRHARFLAQFQATPMFDLGREPGDPSGMVVLRHSRRVLVLSLDGTRVFV